MTDATDATANTGTGSRVTPPPGRYRIDPARTTIGFTTRHMFGLGGVKGIFTLREGTIWISDTAAASRVEVVIDAASFNTNTPRREKDVLSPRFLDAATYPDISFRSESIRESSDGSWTVNGPATVHGVASPAELHVDVLALRGADLTLHATTDADRYAFGMTRGKGMAGRMLHLDLDVVALREDPAAG